MSVGDGDRGCPSAPGRSVRYVSATAKIRLETVNAYLIATD
ncbi:MAG: hypothetical protein ACLT76_06490 [Clostridium fessum]